MAALSSLIRTILAWLFTACFCTGLAIVEAVCLRRAPTRLKQHLVRWWARTVFAILGIRVEFLNENTMESQEARVLMFNHQSALDLVWLAVICPPGPLAIGKKEIFWVPFINLGFWAMEYLYIDRKNPRKALGTLQQAAREVTQRKRTLIIAPEGTRSPDGTVLPFKRGAFKFAVENQAQICPVVCSGAFELLPKQKFLPARGTIRLRFLPPIDTKGLSVADIEPLLHRVRESICAAFNEQNTGAGSPAQREGSSAN